MEAEQLLAQAKRIMDEAGKGDRAVGALVEAREFTRTYAGERSAFYKTLLEVNEGWSNEGIAKFVRNALGAFIRYVENGLKDGLSVQRKAQIDVVSDILEQAQTLLDSKGVHPAAPAVLVGAALEEFLRNWIEDSDLKLGSRKPSIDAYSVVLREADLITKQDAKDIGSWGGIRNHAAHGEWTEVEDRQRVRLMLEGVNLFMRRYSK